MKKIIFTLIAILLQLTMVNAAKLNFRTNTLMFYEYSVNGTVKYFKMYTSNTTNRLMYTESPLIEPSYETDYLLLENALDTFDESIQNKIKSYIRETELEQVFATQMLYYMNTQMLIWKTFHPELDVQIEKEYIPLKETNEFMNNNWNKKPEWITDYEITEKLVIPKLTDTKITTTDCKVKEDANNWIIDNCQENAKIKVYEIGEESLKFHQNDSTLVIESGFSKRQWTFNIKTIPHKEEAPNEEEKIEKNPNIQEKQEEKKIPTLTLNNVPNTMENKTNLLNWYIFLLFMILKCRN